MFAQHKPLGTLKEVQLVLAPRLPDEPWQLVPIVSIGRRTNESLQGPLTVVTAADGSHYGGLALQRLTLGAEELDELVRLPTAGDPDERGRQRGIAPL